MRTFIQRSATIALMLLVVLLAACSALPGSGSPQVNTPAVPVVPVTGIPSPTAVGPEVSTAVPAIIGSPAPSETPAPGGPPPEGLILTRENNGQTISMVVGQTALLNLGEPYKWSVMVSDDSIITREKNILVIRGAQGIYQALKPGQATLSAVGDPVCRDQKPPCMMPSVTFEVTIIVQ